MGERERQRQGKRANWKDEITKQKQPRTHSLGPLKKEDTSLLFPYTGEELAQTQSSQCQV